MNKLFPRAAMLASALLCLTYSVSGLAQGARNYPDKPVRLIVGYSPGGLPDTIARIVAQLSLIHI